MNTFQTGKNAVVDEKVSAESTEQTYYYDLLL
jgi:hypothetical protein